MTATRAKTGLDAEIGVSLFPCACACPREIFFHIVGKVLYTIPVRSAPLGLSEHSTIGHNVLTIQK